MDLQEPDLEGNSQSKIQNGITIPVSEIPISITRTYDTLRANRTDDFGYGWHLEF